MFTALQQFRTIKNNCTLTIDKLLKKKYRLVEALEHHRQRQSCVDQEPVIHPLQSQHQTDSMVEPVPTTEPDETQLQSCNPAHIMLSHYANYSSAAQQRTNSSRKKNVKFFRLPQKAILELKFWLTLPNKSKIK